MNINALICMGVCLMIGANFGFIIAGLFGGSRDDEDMPDQ